MIKKILPLAALLIATQADATITVRDDDGNTVTLQKPAQRIISLAPHVTELLFAAGGGERIVGVVNYSDYPEAAKKIQNVGGDRQVDMERVLALKPDLIVVWKHGSSDRQIDTLRQLGVPIFHSEPTKLDDIGDNMLRLGKLMGTASVAQAAAADLRAQLTALRTKYAGRPAVRMFYQVWDKPLYTLSGSHIVSDAMRVCGGENVFAAMKTTAPIVNVEAVLQLDPEVIFGSDEKNDGGVNSWRQYPAMTAVKNANLFTLERSLLNRSGPRMIAGTAAMCEKLELARQHRKTLPRMPAQ
jgi:iron complex transport system substrate-binding protein